MQGRPQPATCHSPIAASAAARLLAAPSRHAPWSGWSGGSEGRAWQSPGPLHERGGETDEWRAGRGSGGEAASRGLLDARQAGLLLAGFAPVSQAPREARAFGVCQRAGACMASKALQAHRAPWRTVP